MALGDGAGISGGGGGGGGGGALQLPRHIGTLWHSLIRGPRRRQRTKTHTDEDDEESPRRDDELDDDDDDIEFHDDVFDDDLNDVLPTSSLSTAHTVRDHADSSRPLLSSSANRPHTTSSSCLGRIRRHTRRRRPLQRSPCAMFLLVLAAVVGVVILMKWRSEKRLRVRWVPDPETTLFMEQPLGPPPEHLVTANFTLPLRTKGRNIVDAEGQRFKLASINWYGASDELFVVGGLNIQHRTVIAETIKKLGFNSVRLPYADELVTSNPHVDPALLDKNPDLIGLRALDIFHAVTRSLTDAGLAVIINDHITSATWCCGADPCDAGWANDHLGPLCRVKQTEEDWIRNWETIMAPHVDNPLVIGADLRNEVRGLWGTMPWASWAAAAERCGNRLLKMNPDWLIVVAGTESSNDLSGARTRPVKLDVADRLVYSAHVYSWSGWGSLGGRFLQRTYPSFAETMRYNWGYLLEQDIAPVWIGEFGGSHSPTIGGRTYWENLFRYLSYVDADFGYWALNPRKPRRNALESYALVADDYVTPILDYRMKSILDLMHQ